MAPEIGRSPKSAFFNSDTSVHVLIKQLKPYQSKSFVKSSFASQRIFFLYQNQRVQVNFLFNRDIFLLRNLLFVNSPLVCLWPVGFLNNVMFNLIYFFRWFARPH